MTGEQGMMGDDGEQGPKGSSGLIGDPGKKVNGTSY